MNGGLPGLLILCSLMKKVNEIPLVGQGGKPVLSP